MRPSIIALTLVSAALVMASSGHAQTDQGQARPKSNVAASHNPPEDSSFWPSSAEETKIPYRPCDASVVLANGRHACLDQ
jgi:hypothetical protein